MELLQRINEKKLILSVNFLNFKQKAIKDYWLGKCCRFLNSLADSIIDWDSLYTSRQATIIQRRWSLKSHSWRIWFW